MPFEVTTMKDQAEQQDVWVADRKLWVTADKSKVVEDGDPAAAFLLIAAGQSMPRIRAEELGVVREAKRPEPDADLKEKEKPEDKQKAKPATKSRKSKK